MSRTDKTDPYWVRATWWKPYHYGCQHVMFSRGRLCDLPPEPIVAAEYRLPRMVMVHRSCIWVPSYCDQIAHGMGTAPSWFNTIYFTRPERARVRDQLNRARQEYRATRDIDTEIEVAQHRHRGNWDWW